MISLPPGCTVAYGIWIDINEMTNDILDWYKLIEGRVTEDTWINHRGRTVHREIVQYGSGKKCHYRQDGTGGIRLHFDGKDAAVASMFLMKFFEQVGQHNLKEVQDRRDRDNAQ
jgi:hypothetical protein